MAAKLKCPKCGAKNALDAPRCRLCTAVLSGGQPAGLPGGRSVFSGGSGLGARIAAAGNAPPTPAAPAAPAQPADTPMSAFGAPVDDNAFHPLGPDLAGPRGVASHEPSPASPASPATGSAAFEPFDPNALFDRPPTSGAAPSDEPAPSFEPFDPDALFRDG